MHYAPNRNRCQGYMTTEFAEKANLPEVKTHDETGKFLPGHHIGRPRKGETYAEITAALPLELKRSHVMAISEKALDGDVRAFEALRDTAEGRPQQRVEVHDTSMDTEVFDKVLAALAAAGAIQVIEGEFTELPND
jgi:hypothetical protein